MSLTSQTQKEVTQLAESMISEGVNTALYRNFGTLVRANSDDFKKFENGILLGEIEVKDEKFILFNK